jgi:hypothetical protein
MRPRLDLRPFAQVLPEGRRDAFLEGRRHGLNDATRMLQAWSVVPDGGPVNGLD